MTSLKTSLLCQVYECVHNICYDNCFFGKAKFNFKRMIKSSMHAIYYIWKTRIVYKYQPYRSMERAFSYATKNIALSRWYVFN